MRRRGKTSPINLSILSADPSIQLVSYGDDPLRHLASLLLDRHKDELPDLSRQVVLFPQSSTIPRFRQLLLQLATERGFSALLPPDTATLSSFAQRFTTPDKFILGNTARELVLFDMVNTLPDLCRQCGAWALVDSLLALFDALTLNQCTVVDDAENFAQTIAANYGIGACDFSPCQDEARLVHALWHGWKQRLADGNHYDAPHAIVDGLTRNRQQPDFISQIYFSGVVDSARAEMAWIKTHVTQKRLTVVLHGQSGATGYHPDAPITRMLQELHSTPSPITSDDNYTAFLNRAYAQNQNILLVRAREQKAASPLSPASARLVIHEARHMEQEAQAIDLQVRRYLLQGCRNIGIVTNDRKLARRVRALLERANIVLQDAGGWALSTTSAATAMARWLACLEQNFSYAPLLDLLKSPFLNLAIARPEFSRIVPLFERAIMRQAQITAGLVSYRHAIVRAGLDLDRRHGSGTSDSMLQLLSEIEQAAQDLLPITRGGLQRAIDYFDNLMLSLERLGLVAEYQKDEAGSQLLDVLHEMRAALSHNDWRLHWIEFRQWLLRNIERHRFHPRLQGSGVELMSFAESRLYRFDAVIIAGALREHLPGQIDAPPYFNDGVRAQLGLPGLERQHTVLFHDFRRLLEAAPHVMISLHREHQGERLVPSPWVERLRTFHQLAYGNTLTDVELEQLTQRPSSVIANRDAPLPAPQKFSSARLPASMVPVAFTASSHRRLLDCPYQYYSACGLNLAPEDEIRDDLEKSDYGMRVHRILQAFHTGVPGLPGPWNTSLTPESLAQAQSLLTEISQAVFANDVRLKFSARGWLYRWQASIPLYLKWQMQRAEHWQVQAAELKRERDYTEGSTQIKLSGRIDRLDRGLEGYSIVDYKTGAPPHKDSVASGEDCQLPFYSLLLEENVTQALFLSLQRDGISDKTELSGEALFSLREKVKTRLLSLKQALDTETRLPAWGDAETCALCDMEGLCRKELWLTDGNVET